MTWFIESLYWPKPCISVSSCHHNRCLVPSKRPLSLLQKYTIAPTTLIQYRHYVTFKSTFWNWTNTMVQAWNFKLKFPWRQTAMKFTQQQHTQMLQSDPLYIYANFGNWKDILELAIENNGFTYIYDFIAPDHRFIEKTKVSGGGSVTFLISHLINFFAAKQLKNHWSGLWNIVCTCISISRSLVLVAFQQMNESTCQQSSINGRTYFHI